MSSLKRKRQSTNNANEPATKKKRKLSDRESLICDVKNICQIVSRDRYWTRFRWSNSCTVAHVHSTLNKLSKLSLFEKFDVIEAASDCDSPCIHYRCNDKGRTLLGLLSGPQPLRKCSFLFEIMIRCEDQHLIPLAMQNKIKTDIMRQFSKAEVQDLNWNNYKLELQTSHILTIARFYDRERPDRLQYYEGAIDSLQDFTAETFLNTCWDFNFFRFQKIDSRFNITECGSAEVLDLLQSMTECKESQTFLLLMFIMTAYFKNFVFGAIKSAVLNLSISELNMDVLSCIMSYTMTNHSELNAIFEDESLIKQLMKEVANAEKGWQSIFADIIENDSVYADLYKFQTRVYYDSEKLNYINIVNMAKYGKTLSIGKIKKWSHLSVESDHFKVFEIILNEHCALKISVFKHIFYQVAFEDIKNKNEKWLACVESRIDALKQVLTFKNDRKRFAKLINDWKQGIQI